MVHRMIVKACMPIGGILHASCLAFLERRRGGYEAHRHALSTDWIAGVDVFDNREGIAMEMKPIVDDKIGDDHILSGWTSIPQVIQLFQHKKSWPTSGCSSTCTCYERRFDIKIANETLILSG